MVKGWITTAKRSNSSEVDMKHQSRPRVIARDAVHRVVGAERDWPTIRPAVEGELNRLGAAAES